MRLRLVDLTLFGVCSSTTVVPYSARSGDGGVEVGLSGSRLAEGQGQGFPTNTAGQENFPPAKIALHRRHQIPSVSPLQGYPP